MVKFSIKAIITFAFVLIVQALAHHEGYRLELSTACIVAAMIITMVKLWSNKSI